MVYLERRGRQNKNNKPINLLNGITFSTYFILFLKIKRNDLARPVMGTIFLVSFSCLFLSQ